MALIKCPECHKKISSETEKCVHCGATITREYAENAEVVPVHEFAKSKWLNKKFMIVMSAIVGVLVIVCCAVIIPRQVTLKKYKDILVSCLTERINNSSSHEGWDRLLHIDSIYEDSLYDGDGELVSQSISYILTFETYNKIPYIAYIYYDAYDGSYTLAGLDELDTELEISIKTHSDRRIY